MHKYLKTISNTNNISEWKSKGLSDEVIKAPDNSLAQHQDMIVKECI